MSFVFLHYNNCVMYVFTFEIFGTECPQLIARIYFEQIWLKYFFLHLQRQLRFCSSLLCLQYINRHRVP